MKNPADMTEDEKDQILARFDQTTPDLQREIVLGLSARLAEAVITLEMIADGVGKPHAFARDALKRINCPTPESK